MPQRDYILRMIEQMAMIVAELRRRVLGGDRSGAEGEMRALATQAGFDLSLVDVLDADAILSLLSPGGNPDATRVWLAAELVYLQGLADFQMGNTRTARDAFAKARRLFGALDMGELGPSLVEEAADRIRELDDLLASSSMSID